MAAYLRGVLVAISVPIFTSQLEKSREATDLANARAAKAEAVTEVLDGSATAGTYWYNPATGKLGSSIVACGKGTAATVKGVNYSTDTSYKQFAYGGGDVTKDGIKVVITTYKAASGSGATATPGTDDGVTVTFAEN